MNDAKFQSLKQVNVELAVEKAKLTGTPSTWGFYFEESEYEITATPDGKYKTRRI